VSGGSGAISLQQVVSSFAAPPSRFGDAMFARLPNAKPFNVGKFPFASDVMLRFRGGDVTFVSPGSMMNVERGNAGSIRTLSYELAPSPA